MGKSCAPTADSVISALRFTVTAGTKLRLKFSVGRSFFLLWRLLLHPFQRWRSKKVHHGVTLTSAEDVDPVMTENSEVSKTHALLALLKEVHWKLHLQAVSSSFCSLREFFHRCDSRLRVLNYTSPLFLCVLQSCAPDSSACNDRLPVNLLVTGLA